MELGYKALGYVLNATRPLSVAELLEAMSVEPFSEDRDPDNQPNLKTVLNSCVGLIVEASGSDTIHFAHFSIQEWLVSQRILPDHDLSTVCLTYLTYDKFNDAGSFPPDANEAFEQRLQQYPLLHYAARTWDVHLKQYSEIPDDIIQLILKLFNSKSRFDVMRQARYAVKVERSWSLDRYPGHSSAHHFLAKEGLSEVYKILPLEKGPEIMCLRDSYGRTLLHEACVGRQLKMVEEFIRLAPDSVNVVDRDGSSALHLAADTGDDEIIDILSKANVNPMMLDGVGYTPYQRAKFSGQEKSSNILLTKFFKGLKASNDFSGPKAFKGHTLLHQVAALGFEEGLIWLLEVAKADPYTVTKTGQDTPLHRAAFYGHAGIVRILLEHIDTTKIQRNAYGALPLHLAVRFGRDEVVEILVQETKSEISARDYLGFTPLHWAAAGGNLPMVKRLLPLTEMNLPSEADIPSPNHLAWWGNNIEVMEYLSQYSSDANTVWTCLDESIFNPTTFAELTRGAMSQATSPKKATALLSLLCRYLGERQVRRGNLELASIWFDLDFLTSSGLGCEPLGAVFCDRCMAMIETKARHKCVCMHCTFSPGGCYDICFKCSGNEFKPINGGVHHNFVTVPSSCSNFSLESKLKELEVAISSKFNDYCKI
jgi:ankyrin repeat protein